MNKMCARSRLLAAGLLLALHGGWHATATADSAPDRVTFTPVGPIGGFLFSEWSAAWWQYVLSIPTEINPTQDPTGNQCALAQRGPVWFLVGTTGGVQSANRRCTVPEGKALFFPLLNLLDINTASQTADELRREIAGCLNAATGLLLVVDGQSIPVRREQWRVRSVPFAAVLPAGGLPTIPPTPPSIYSPAVDDGFYVMVRPLPVGLHTIRFAGSSPGCNAPNFHVDPFSQDVTYQITVHPVSLR